MPRDGNGNYTLPAGNPVVSNTLIAATWANTTMPDLGTETTDSLSRSGKGPMLAPLKIVDAALPTPGLSFQNEPTSGILRSGAGDVRHRVLGTDVIGLTQTAFTTYVNKIINGTLNVSGVTTLASLEVTGDGGLVANRVYAQSALAQYGSIENWGVASDSGGLTVCYDGRSTPGGTAQSHFRNFRIYDGKAGLLFFTDGQTGTVNSVSIYNTSVTGRDVHVASAGRLGYLSSSKRYKENERELKDTDFLLKLRPLVYDRKDGSAKNESGLFAEEVEQVAPEYVWHDEKGRPDGVNYKGLVVPILARLQQLEARLN